MRERNKKPKRWVCLMTMVLCLLLMMTGCSQARETMQEMRQELRQEIAMETDDNAIGERLEPLQTNRLEVPSLDDMVKDDLTIEETYEPVRTIGNAVQEITVALYFADADKTKLVKTEKSIPKVEGMARATIETLLEGPEQGSGLVAAVPQGTQLLDINVKQEEKKCIVDFSQELRNRLASGINNEQLAVYSIANTLCQFASIEEVEFRIEGQTVATLAGATDLSVAVTANPSLVK